MVVSLLELILIKKTIIFLELSMKYLDKLNNQLKNFNKSSRLLRLEFKSDNIIKSKAMKLVKPLNKYCLTVSNNKNLLGQF